MKYLIIKRSGLTTIEAKTENEVQAECVKRYPDTICYIPFLGEQLITRGWSNYHLLKSLGCEVALNNKDYIRWNLPKKIKEVGGFESAISHSPISQNYSTKSLNNLL